MHTTHDIRWRGIPTAVDELFFPSIEFGEGSTESGVTLLVSGNLRTGEPGPGYMVEFHHVQAICGYSETVYWSLAEADHRPDRFLNAIEGAALPERVRPLRGLQLGHFLVCGADMCCEIIAADYYDIMAFEDERSLHEAMVRRRLDTYPLNTP